MTGVLVLNASYEPLHIVSYQRAVSLLVVNKVEVVEPGTKVMTSTSRRISIPSVIKLRRYVNVPQRGAIWSRHAVLLRDNFNCVFCGEKLTNTTATVDHVMPQWKCRATGKPVNSWTNTVAACRSCQSRKGGKEMHEVGMRFHDPNYEPRRPRTRYLVVTSNLAPEWKKYIEI